MINFQVSVIIPVYNAAKFLNKAVKSAVHQKSVGEIILIEDGSPDNALKICEQLRDEYEKVKIFRHPEGANKGAGASRNLGIQMASFNYIAFLDADDWYLPERFKKAKNVFKSLESIDGVYEPVGTHFYDSESFYLGKIRSKKEGEKMVTFLHKEVKSNKLFYELISSKNGWIHLNGFTVKKSLIQKIDPFSTDLKLHQDTEFLLRCAFHGKLVAPKNAETIAIRAVHASNRIKTANSYSYSQLYESLLKQYFDKNLSFKTKILLLKKAALNDKRRKLKDSNVFIRNIEMSYIFLTYLPFLWSRN